ncbi:MAG: TolC family outer membrane protein [Burkholderiales bacterium]|nr:TolC family outer membrane protein [Burkholderiales bacterium]
MNKVHAAARAAAARRRRCRATLAAALWAAGAAFPARAMTLNEAFDAALAHDAQYRAALYDRDSAQQGVPIARAQLLPQASLSYSTGEVEGTRSFPNASDQEVTARLQYRSPQAALSLRMPLFNYEAWSRLDQAQAQARGADESLRARGLDLVDRLVQAYLQLVEARAVLALNAAEVLALEEQHRRTEHRLRLGEGTRTDVAQALAELELARVRQAEAHERLALGMARLQRLTGRTPAFVNDVPPDFAPQAVPLTTLRDQTEQALADSPAVRMRLAALDSARFAVRRNQAGHLPRVDAVASVTRSRNESLANLDQTSRLFSVGVQLSVPLFNGGGVDASVRQAELDAARAAEDLRAEQDNLRVELRRLLQSADAAAQRTQALRKAVAASEVALEGATRALAAGLGTQSDVLVARSRLLSARRDLAQAQYEHLMARSRVSVLAGEPMQQVVDRLAAELAVRVDF